MSLGERKDPFLGYNFAVEVEGCIAGGFSEVTGLQIELETHDYREGGVNQYLHRRAGPAKYPNNIVLKKGLTDQRALWSWYWDCVRGKVTRRNLSILLMDSTGQEKVRWNFERAYPVKWTGPDMRAGNSEIAAESLEFAHCGLAGA